MRRIYDKLKVIKMFTQKILNSESHKILRSMNVAMMLSQDYHMRIHSHRNIDKKRKEQSKIHDYTSNQ